MSEQSTDIHIAGKLATHADAEAFSLVVQRVHHRYASEIVGAFSLCPFMNDPKTAFGHFCVILDQQLDIDVAVEAVRSADAQVVHLVYPLLTIESRVFERFGNQLHLALEKIMDRPPVHASFHPQMRGDRAQASRLVGVVRRAPDPFVQFVPEGLQQGGTAFIDPAKLDLAALAKMGAPKKGKSLSDLTEEQLDVLEMRIKQIHQDRDEHYAPFLAKLA